MSVILDDWHPDVFRKFDPDVWVETFASTGTQLVQLQSKDHSGNAHYVSEPDHTHMGYGGRDAFGEMQELLHQRGILVMANQSTIVDNYQYNQHPDWRMRDAECRDSKALSTLGGRPGIVCPNSPYRDLLRAQLEAFGRKYPVDVVFLDMVRFWIPICHCASCGSKYRADSGRGLPMGRDWASSEYRRYVRWRNDCLYDFVHHVTERFRAVRPDAAVVFQSPRYFLEGHRGGSTLRMLELCDYVGGDPLQSDPSISLSLWCTVWDNMTPHRPAAMSVPRFHVTEDHHVGIKPPEELAAMVITCWAHGLAVETFDITNVDGTLYSSVYQAIKDVYDRAEPVEQFFGGEKFRCVAVYASEETRDYWVESHSDALVAWYASGIGGAFAAFERQHMPVDVISKLNLDELDDFELLCLPDTLCMTAREIAAVREYVEKGGNLLVSHLTSLADENGDRCHNFALADVLGVDYLGETENNETYASVDPDLCRQSGIPADQELKLESQALVKMRPGAKAPGHIVLPATNRANDQERWVGCWGTPPQIRTDFPAIVMNTHGRGRVCYLAGRTGSGMIWDRGSYTTLTANPFLEQRRLYATLGRSLIGEASIPLQADAPVPVVITGFRQPEEHRIVVHVVNNQREVPFIPVRDIPVTVRVAEGEHAVGVVSQPGGQNLDFQQDGLVVSFVVPKVQIYQSFVLGLS